MHKIIQELEADNSRLKKEAIIRRESDADNIEFFNGVGMALDGFRTFGLKQVPKATKDGPGLSWERFAYVVDKLEKRELTGNDMRKTVDHLCETAKVEQWNDWYRRILIKDLRCGVTHKTINKHSKIKVPVFECMLADDSKKHEKKMTGEVLVEPKLDGVRVVVICDVDKDEVKLFSRNGKELSNFPKILQQFDEMLDQMPESMVFDGEVMSEDFQTLMKQVHRKEGAQTEDSYLAVFDMLTLEEFDAGGTSKNAIERRQRIVNLSDLFTYRIQLVDATLIDMDSEEGQAKFQAMNKRALDEGYEGLMIKPVSEGYKCKRSHAWLKIKPFIEVTLKVVELEEGTGKNEGLLGALVVEGEDDGKFFRLNVGSGLTDENREQIWENQDKVIGQLVEIRADAATQSQDADDVWSLRFPRFKTFRGFELGEKL